MKSIAFPLTLLGTVLACLLPLMPAFALTLETWVSSTGSDSNSCADPSSPCRTFSGALVKTIAGGQINVMDTADYTSVAIDKSVSIVNDTSGTASIIGQEFINGEFANIIILAGPNDVVTLRGLVIKATDNADVAEGILIHNASRVNIENCVVLNASGPGIKVAPNTEGLPITLAASINVKIQDTTINGGAAGIVVTSVSTLPVNVAIDRTRIDNNLGGGLKADGTSGGPVKVIVSDSSISLNASNGVNAVSGALGNVKVDLIRDVIASNGLAGVQANQSSGGTATVTVNSTSIVKNLNALESVGGAALFTFGNNGIVGAVGTGFTGTIGLQ